MSYSTANTYDAFSRLTRTSLAGGFIDTLGTIHAFIPDYQRNIVAVVNCGTDSLKQFIIQPLKACRLFMLPNASQTTRWIYITTRITTIIFRFQ